MYPGKGTAHIMIDRRGRRRTSVLRCAAGFGAEPLASSSQFTCDELWTW